ncbi:MAG: OmpA family protein [Sphingomonadales bacterium]
MTSQTFKVLILSTSMLVIAGCAGREPNPEISYAQTRLSTAYSNKNTADRGRADLENARSALQMAEQEWQSGDEERSQHHLTMAGIHLDLADTRGEQATIEQQIADVENQRQMAAVRAEARSDADRSRAEVEQMDARLADRDQRLTEQEEELASAREQLREYDMKITELGSTLVLQDVSFETGKTDLREGASNRLNPLVNFLKASPQTRVLIEGHTDNVGGEAFNRQLSLDRANSVASALTDAGIDRSRIETTGSGYSKPVGNNDTVSGRQSNRRVEITLLD